MSMRVRLILSFILIVLVSVVSVVLIARTGTVQAVQAFMVRGSMTGVDELVQSLEAYYHQNQSWQGAEVLLRGPGSGGFGHGQGGMMGNGNGGMMAGGIMDQRLRLANAQGVVVVDTVGSSDVGNQLTQAEISNAIPISDSGRTVGYLLAEGGVSVSPSDQAALLARLNQAALTAALIGGAVSLLLALLLSYGLLHPIRALTQASQAVARRDLSRRVPVRGTDELAQLGQSFNQMAESLQKAEESRKAMTADIAHELRTPLSVQRAHLEALQDGIYALTPENLQPVIDQNLVLTRLVEDLRTLALGDAGQITLERAPARLSVLIEDIIEHFKPQAEAQRVELSFEPPSTPGQEPVLSLDARRIEQIIANLLTNALRHTPESGHIRLALHYNPDQAFLSVQDSGPGIPPEALPHIFERFYRASRSRSRSEGGTGLGLPIALQLAEAHGGRLEAANAPQGGAIFTLILPVREAIVRAAA